MPAAAATATTATRTKLPFNTTIAPSAQNTIMMDSMMAIHGKGLRAVLCEFMQLLRTMRRILREGRTRPDVRRHGAIETFKGNWIRVANHVGFHSGKRL